MLGSSLIFGKTASVDRQSFPELHWLLRNSQSVFISRKAQLSYSLYSIEIYLYLAPVFNTLFPCPNAKVSPLYHFPKAVAAIALHSVAKPAAAMATTTSSQSSVSSDSTANHNLHDQSARQVTNNADIEKGLSDKDQDELRARRVTSARISRVQSLSNRRAYDNTFSHPLAHAKTAEDVIVDFEGSKDPYHPLNWPLRKKVITTTLYGLCTMVSL